MGRPIKFVVKKGGKGAQVMTSVKSSNGNIMLTGRGYNSKANAKKTLNSIVKKIQEGEFEIVEE